MKFHTPSTRYWCRVFVAAAIVTWLVGLLNGCGSPRDEFRVSVDLTSLFEYMADVDSFVSGEKRIMVSHFAFDPENQINKASELYNQVIETPTFEFVGRINEPYRCEIEIQYPNEDGVTYWGEAAIIGPGSEIQIGFDVMDRRLTITGNKWHHRLISSNPNADVLEEATEQFFTMYEEWYEQWRQEDGTFSAPDRRETWIASFLADLTEKEIQNSSIHLSSEDDLDCSTFQEDEPNRESDVYQNFEHWPQSLITAEQQMRQFRFQYLDEVAQTSADPMDRLLALETGGLAQSDIDTVVERLRIYDEIAEGLSPSLVARRIEPDQIRLRSILDIHAANQAIVPGQIAPAFVATDQAGNSVGLKTILAEHEAALLYLNFGWTEINSDHYVALERLQNNFGNQGLVIVSVYVNANETYWDATKFDTPWQTLVAFSSDLWFEPDPIVLNYGILGTPKVLLVADSGCIMKLNPTFAELEVFLDSALAEPKAD